MTRTDRLVERGADKLKALSEQAARRGGVATKLAEPLAEDAEFLRKLRPSLIAARARGEAPTDEQPTETHAPAAPREAPKTKATSKPRRRGGPNPFVVAGAALAAGILLAKWIDWRGHAHPRV